MRYIKLLLIIKFLSVLTISIIGAKASILSSDYVVKSSGIKIGEFNWIIKIEEEKYETKISLKSIGILSQLYSFEGEYLANGIFKNNRFETRFYKQYWKTKNKEKIVEIELNRSLINLFQHPKEEEHSRVSFSEIIDYYDPITSFINILNGHSLEKTIDGRRLYVMEKSILDTEGDFVIFIKEYRNLWADHKRNDLEKIEFIIKDGVFLPIKINIYFKNRVFKLSKI